MGAPRASKRPVKGLTCGGHEALCYSVRGVTMNSCRGTGFTSVGATRPPRWAKSQRSHRRRGSEDQTIVLLLDRLTAFTPPGTGGSANPTRVRLTRSLVAVNRHLHHFALPTVPRARGLVSQLKLLDPSVIRHLDAAELYHVICTRVTPGAGACLARRTSQRIVQRDPDRIARIVTFGLYTRP